MADNWADFRVSQGRVAVGDDAVRVRSTPTSYLAGQYAALRQGGLTRRAGAALGILGLVLTPLFLAGTVSQVTDVGVGYVALWHLVSVAGALVGLWYRYLRDTVIPVDAIEDVRLDEATRRLTITHARREGPFSSVREPRPTRRLTLRSADDVREARSALRLAGIDYRDADDPEPETVYRVETRGGVAFCADCGSQVSPGEPECPACGYALRVELSESA